MARKAKTSAVLRALFILATIAHCAPATAHGKPAPQTQTAFEIPEEIKKLKGKTVRILFEIDPERQGKPSTSGTAFFAELLGVAGVKVALLHDLKIKYVADEVLVLGDLAEVPPDEFDALAEIKVDRRGRLEALYHQRKAQIAADARAAGMGVVSEGQVAAFFGLSRGTDTEIQRLRDKALLAKLDVGVPQFKMNGVGLDDVLDFFRDAYDVNIFVNWKKLESSGIKKDATVTVNFTNVAFSKALQATLDSASGTNGRLTFDADANVITIGMATDLFGDTVSRKYDIRLLVPEKLTAENRDKRVATFLKLLIASIDPPSWGIHGDKTCAVMELNGDLIVVQTEQNQKSIESLIRHLPKLMSITTPQSHSTKESQ